MSSPKNVQRQCPRLLSSIHSSSDASSCRAGLLDEISLVNSSTTPVTVFAPTNAAFAAAALDAGDTTTVSAVLENHIVPDMRLAAPLSAPVALESLEGAKLFRDSWTGIQQGHVPHGWSRCVHQQRECSWIIPHST